MIYHVQTHQNPADILTRPDKVNISDVGPNSTWERGLPWMRDEIKVAVESNILTTSKELRVMDKDKPEYDSGLVFEQSPEVLVRGHTAYPTKRTDQVTSSAANISKYLVLPTKFQDDCKNHCYHH